MTPKTVKISARWTLYGPKFYHKGRRLDCEGDAGSWELAVHGLWDWLKGNRPVFSGPAAAPASEAWSALVRSLASPCDPLDFIIQVESGEASADFVREHAQSFVDSGVWRSLQGSWQRLVHHWAEVGIVTI